jgi:hypothetical protein
MGEEINLEFNFEKSCWQMAHEINLVLCVVFSCAATPDYESSGPDLHDLFIFDVFPAETSSRHYYYFVFFFEFFL